MKNKLFFKIIAVILLQAFLVLDVLFAADIASLNTPKDKQDCLSPILQINNATFIKFFYNLQHQDKKDFQPFISGTLIFLDFLMEYISENPAKIPMIIKNESVLLPAVNPSIDLDREVPITLDNLNMLRKLIKRKKVALVFDKNYNRSFYFRLVSFESDLIENKNANTLRAFKEIFSYLGSTLGMSSQQTQAMKEKAANNAILNKLVNLTPSEFDVIVRIYRMCAEDDQGNKGRMFNLINQDIRDEFEKTMKIYRSIVEKYNLPEFYGFIKFVKDQGGAPALIEAYFSKKNEQMKQEVEQSEIIEDAEKDFKKLIKTDLFKKSMSRIIREYLDSGGEERGENFINFSKAIPMRNGGLLTVYSGTIRDVNAVCSVHTHNATICEHFFLPSTEDEITSIALGRKNGAILWGDPKLGFYLTVTHGKQLELRQEALKLFKARLKNMPLDLTRIWELINDNAEKFKYYRLEGEGVAEANKLFSSYALVEIECPKEVIKTIIEDPLQILDRLWGYWERKEKVRLRKQFKNAIEAGRDVHTELLKLNDSAKKILLEAEGDRKEIDAMLEELKNSNEKFSSGDLEEGIHEMRQKHRIAKVMHEIFIEELEKIKPHVINGAVLVERAI